MASNERSLGWNTGTSNDGASTYATDRMIAMETKTLGNGTMITGGLLALSGVGTSTLTIADGAAVINGYFYESTSASTIPTNTLNGTYTLALIANNSGGTYTVSQSTAGTAGVPNTSVLDKTVRMALATGTLLGPIGSGNYIAYASVVVNASGQITTINSYFPFAQTRQLPNTQYVYLNGGTATLTAASTYYDVTNYGGVGNVLASNDGTVTANATTGAITVRQSGVYTFSILMKFDTNSSGYRKASIRNFSYDFNALISSAMLADGTNSIYQASGTMPITVALGGTNTYYLQAWSTISGRTVIDSYFTVTRV